MVPSCVALAGPGHIKYKGAHLHSAQDIRLKQLLVAVCVVHQRAIVHDGVHLAAQLLVDALLQAQIRLRKIAWRQTTSLSAWDFACLASSTCCDASLQDKPFGSTEAPCRGLQAEMFTAGMPGAVMHSETCGGRS